jgi:signal transduction histidine kinase
MNTEKALLPLNEMERLLHLSAFNVDFTEYKESFSDLARLAASVAGTSISQVNLIDFYTQWTVSNHGLDSGQTPREDSVCQYTILNGDYFEVKDMSVDRRFCDKDYVIGDPEIRYYLGVPLSVGDGVNIGALCVLDQREKVLSGHQISLLKIIAGEIVHKLQAIKTVEQLRLRVSESETSNRKAAHDIRGPLAGIIGLTQIIESQGNDNDISEVLELVGLIQQSGNSLIELTQEILGKRQNALGFKEGSSMKELKEKLQKLYEPQARHKAIALTIETNPETENIRGRNSRLLHITGNLIGNALKFTPEGGEVNVRLDVVQQADDGGRDIEIAVKDTGVGLSEEQIIAVATGNAIGTDGTCGEEGFGMGLGFVKNLVETDQGNLMVSSVMGHGATFTVRLPLEV